VTSEIPGTRRAQCGIYEALWLARLHAVSAHALYLHIPFCARKCAYCDFLSWQTSRGDACLRDYVDALVRQIEEAGAAGLLAGVETAYVGGGTPSLLGADLLGRVVRTVREHAPRVQVEHAVIEGWYHDKEADLKPFADIFRVADAFRCYDVRFEFNSASTLSRAAHVLTLDHEMKPGCAGL
jgi:hypothetical protein